MVDEARENQRNVENAFDAEVARVGVGACRYFIDRSAHVNREDVRRSDKEGAAKLAHAKGHVEIANAGVARASGDEESAVDHERRADKMFELRDAIRRES